MGSRLDMVSRSGDVYILCQKSIVPTVNGFAINTVSILFMVCKRFVANEMIFDLDLYCIIALW